MTQEAKFVKYWRPAMAWSYLVVCVWDFMLAPIFFALYRHHSGIAFETWKPLTMSEGGFYHLAMGAIIGVTAWTRGQENIVKLNKTDPPPPTS